MSELTLIRKKTTIKDDEGNVVIEAPILDLYYIITNSFIGNENLPPRNSLTLAALQINAEYGTDLSWGEVSDILESLHVMLEEIKKKNTSMPV